MTATNETYKTLQNGQNDIRGIVQATFNAEGDVTTWRKFANGAFDYGISGQADAATVALQFSPTDPAAADAPVAIEVDDTTGDPLTGGFLTAVPWLARGWYRLLNKTTFGPASNATARTLATLAAAINGLQASPVNNFAPGTSPQPLVTAVVASATTLVLTAATPGTAGNAIATTETLTNGAWGAATLAGGVALASALGTLTFAANNANNETVTIGSTVYTYKTTLTGAANEILIGADLTASRNNLVAAINATGTGGVGTLTFAANAAATETVRVGNYIYTFVAALSSVGAPFEVLIGATASDSLDNLIDAINSAAATAGVKYGYNTPPNPLATAAAGAGDTAVITSVATGAAGNEVITLETGAQMSWGAAKTAGATGAGATYGAGTVANTQVTAATSSTDKAVVTAITGGAAGNAIATTETGAQMSWGAATLASGANAVAATGTLTMSGVFNNTGTVTVGSVVYTAKTALTPTAGEFQIAGIQSTVTLTGPVDAQNFAQN